MSQGRYPTDILVWAREQADLLERLARGERVNEVDWPHVIEGIRDVGQAELNRVKSNLLQALRHLVKLAAEPDAQAVRHWSGEVRTFLAQADQAFAPSMRQEIDLPGLWQRARSIAIDETGVEEGAVAMTLPFALDDLLDPGFDPRKAAGVLRAQA